VIDKGKKRQFSCYGQAGQAGMTLIGQQRLE